MTKRRAHLFGVDRRRQRQYLLVTRDFGVAVAAQNTDASFARNARVDHVTITVHYTEAAAGVTLQQRSAPAHVLRGARRGIL